MYLRFFPALEYDSYVSIGLDSEAGFGEEDHSIGGEDVWGPSFLAGGNLDITGGVAGDGWYVPAGAANGYAGDDLSYDCSSHNRRYNRRLIQYPSLSRR